MITFVVSIYEPLADRFVFHSEFPTITQAFAEFERLVLFDYRIQLRITKLVV